jgi:hypothetical protein
MTILPVLASILFSFGSFQANAQQLPSLKNLVQVFDGLNAPFIGSNLVPCGKCDDPHHENPLTGEFDKENPLNDELYRPDTVYSWMQPENVKSRLDSLNVQTWQGMWRPLFLTRAPLASYPYGSVSLRFKIKPGVHFKRERNHCKVSLSEAETTVYVFAGLMSEFVICSPKVIESVSFAMKEHYDEMIRDLIQHKERPEAASYYMRFSQTGDRGFFNSGDACPDNMCYRESTLMNNLRATLRLILRNQSRLVYNPDTMPSEQTELRHFQTLRPIYFNAD